MKHWNDMKLEMDVSARTLQISLKSRLRFPRNKWYLLFCLWFGRRESNSVNGDWEESKIMKGVKNWSFVGGGERRKKVWYKFCLLFLLLDFKPWRLVEHKLKGGLWKRKKTKVARTTTTCTSTSLLILLLSIHPSISSTSLFPLLLIPTTKTIPSLWAPADWEGALILRSSIPPNPSALKSFLLTIQTSCSSSIGLLAANCVHLRIEIEPSDKIFSENIPGCDVRPHFSGAWCSSNKHEGSWFPVHGSWDHKSG